MKRTSQFPVLILGGACWLLATTAGAQPSAQDACPEFARLAEAAVPQRVGDRQLVAGLLRPDVTQPQLGRAFTVDRARQAVQDPALTDKALPCPPEAEGHNGHGERTFPGQEGTLLRADLDRGQIAYLNRQRSVGALQVKEGAITQERAIEAAIRTAEALGVPVAELDRKGLSARALIAAGRDPDRRQPATKVQTAIHVRIPRQIGNVPVFDSYLQAAVNPSSEIARLHVQWPDFALVYGLSVESALPRQRVVQNLRETLAETHLCGTLSRVRAEIAYVPADQLAISSSEGDEGDKRPNGVARPFVPALVVYAVPVEPEENSGKIGMGAQQFVIPLFRGAGDR